MRSGMGSRNRPDDQRFMDVALVLAGRGLGRVAPNPAVGCVVVRDGIIVGRGWTQPGGRPHAETEALRRAGEAARGATAYVTFEPCAHYGETGPCAQALIDAGIARVVGAMTDPDPRVCGQGYGMLREAGVEVVDGVGAAAAHHLNEGFIKHVVENRPLVTLKIASSIDGRTATHSGESQWITGADARNRGHLMRATTDAIMVGSTTAVVDDPDLTCRLPGLEERSPARIVADGRLRLPLTARLVRSAHETPVWILTQGGGDQDRRKAFQECGVELIDVPTGAEGAMDMGAALELIAGRGITRLLVEGGSHLASSLMAAGLVDRIEWFQAPKVIGGDGFPAIGGFGVEKLGMAPALVRTGMVSMGEDSLLSYVVRRD